MVSQAAGQTVTGTETLLESSSLPAALTVTVAAPLVAGRYRLLQPLGTGGMGHVYLAEDTLLARKVAIKTIRPELSNNQEVRNRIKRESRMHAAIGTHPHIITLYDTIEEQGHIYLVLEYFAAETLTRLLARQRILSLNTALIIIRQLLQALACIHQRDIVHRDIKTSNVLVLASEPGNPMVKLTDFGIARAELDENTLTQLTCLDSRGPGTPAYMAPERIDPQTHGRMSPATDLYAVGIILFEMLAGQPPFRGPMTDIFTGHLLHAPGFNELPASLPAPLIDALARVLAKKPGERFQDAEAFQQALAGLDGEQIHLSVHSPTVEATLLQPMDAIDQQGDVCKATILMPNATGLGLPLLKRAKKWWIPLAALTTLVLVFLALLLQRTDREITGSNQPSLNKAPSAQAIDPRSSPVLPPEPHETTALQAVETARRPGAEAMTGASRNETAPAEAQGWRVIDNQSKKLQ